MSGFVSLLYTWKIIGATSWAIFFGFLSFFFINVFTTFFDHYLNYLILPTSLIGLIPVIIIYFFCLTNIPARYYTLSAIDLFYRICFMFTHAFWLWLLGLTATSSKDSLICSILVTFVTMNTEKSVLYFTTKRQARILKVFNASTFGISKLIAIVIISIVAHFICTNGSFVPVFLDFFMSSLVLTITAVVAGERVSFQKDGMGRIIQYLNSYGYIKFLAYLDLYAISTGPVTRRTNILRDTSIQTLISVLQPCKQTLKAYMQQHQQIQNYNHHTFIPVREGIISKILRKRRERHMRFMREMGVLENSLIIILDVQSMIMLLTSKDDIYGLGQTQMKEVKKLLEDALEIVSLTLQTYSWSTKKFGRIIECTTPKELTNATLSTIRKAIQVLVSKGVN